MDNKNNGWISVKDKLPDFNTEANNKDKLEVEN